MAGERHETGIQWTHVPGYRGATWNPTTGCARVSAGCDHCYAFELHDQRYIKNRDQARMFVGVLEPEGSERHIRSTESWRAYAERVGEPSSGWATRARELGATMPFPAQYDVPFSTVQVLDEKRLTEPLRRRIPTAYFVDSMSDLFHEDVPDDELDRIFGVMALTQFVGRCRARGCDHEWCDLAKVDKPPQHVYMALTKRPERMNAYINAPDRIDAIVAGARSVWNFEPVVLRDQLTWPLPNVWLGVSVEDHAAADERIPWLIKTPAAVRFLSCEPLLGRIEFSDVTGRSDAIEQWGRRALTGIDWVIAGGESGRRARPMDLAWARSLRDQCAAADVPFFMKQLGSRPMLPLTEDGQREWNLGHLSGLWRAGGEDGSAYRRDDLGLRLGYAMRLRNSHGADLEEWPEDLRVRQWPAVGAVAS